MMFFVFSSLLLFTLSSGSFDDNELLAPPEISCNADTIELQFKTRKPFTGKVFVKGNYDRPECRVEYGRRGADDNPVGGIRLNHGACNMDRQRTLSPEGMMFSTVLIISFHPLFLTKMDKAYNIKCMYREVERTVQAAIDVSNLPTEPLAFDMPIPQCTYTIRKDSLDGEILRFARVGDLVVHRWQCDSEDYGILVHSCYVEDGQGEKQQVVDEKGCHSDRLLLGDPTYVEALNMAYREAFVFKFADRVAIRFQCEIRLCVKEENGCDGITPPICLENTESNAIFEDDIPLPMNISRRTRRDTSSKTALDADLISQTVYVLDTDEAAVAAADRKICLPVKHLLYCLVGFVILTAVTTIASVYYLIRKRRRRDDKISETSSDFYRS